MDEGQGWKMEEHIGSYCSNRAGQLGLAPCWRRNVKRLDPGGILQVQPAQLTRGFDAAYARRAESA